MSFRPYAIHIATEGPVGLAARRICIQNGWAFSTSYHTRYPEYLRARWPIPLTLSYAWLRSFHNAAQRTFVSSESLKSQLTERGFSRLHIWRRGVDLSRFRPAEPDVVGLNYARPLMVYAGRVAVEKNLPAFLDLDVPGTKLVIGDGPQLSALRARYPNVVFTGFRLGDELARLMSAADVFVFPSRTDTFGLVMIEAMACGVPVAAFPVPGPLDVIEQNVTGVLHDDLGVAIQRALQLDRHVCAERASRFSWEAATDQFLEGLVPLRALTQSSRVRLSSRGGSVAARPRETHRWKPQT